MKEETVMLTEAMVDKIRQEIQEKKKATLEKLLEIRNQSILKKLNG